MRATLCFPPAAAGKCTYLCASSHGVSVYVCCKGSGSGSSTCLNQSSPPLIMAALCQPIKAPTPTPPSSSCRMRSQASMVHTLPQAVHRRVAVRVCMCAHMPACMCAALPPSWPVYVYTVAPFYGIWSWRQSAAAPGCHDVTSCTSRLVQPVAPLNPRVCPITVSCKRGGMHKHTLLGALNVSSCAVNAYCTVRLPACLIWWDTPCNKWCAPARVLSHFCDTVLSHFCDTGRKLFRFTTFAHADKTMLRQHCTPRHQARYVLHVCICQCDLSTRRQVC